MFSLQKFSHYLQLCLAALFCLTLSHCKTRQDDPQSSQTTQEPPANDTSSIVINFTYGSEKKKWIAEATTAFNNARHKTTSGKTIFIKEIPMGSGQCVREVINGERETHLISPASKVFINTGNSQSLSKINEPLVQKTTDLCLSPVVIAMWKPMAEALGYPDKDLGWKEIHDLSINPQGWASTGNPQWGDFRFGHTHPDYSNSGIISLLAEVYAASGKQTNLTLADIQNPTTGAYLEELENSIIHYGKSTGFFGRKMFAGGPSYLSAAVLYENMVIESQSRTDLAFPVIAIYPKEGTFWSDHPAGIVNRPYVTDEHKEAASAYLDFLLSDVQQEAAQRFGFRPASLDIPTSDIFPRDQPKTTLKVPSTDLIFAIRDLWFAKKKSAHVTLALDISGSMKVDGKLGAAKLGAKQLLSMLSDRDQFSFIIFSSKSAKIIDRQTIGNHRDAINATIDKLFANGGTALYDAIYAGYTDLKNQPKNNKITSLVVLTDGADTNSSTTLQQLITDITASNEEANTRIFTIAYGDSAETNILKNISHATNAKTYKADTANIRTVFEEIATFF